MNENLKKIIHGSKEEVMNTLFEDLKLEHRRVLITANSETFVFSQDVEEVQNLLKREETRIVIDGIAAFRGLKYLGIENIAKVPGVDIVQELLEYCDKNKLNVAVFGANEDSIQSFKRYLKAELPNLNLVAISNGYVEDKQAVLESYSVQKPDLILVALGVPLQERLIHETIDSFDKGVFIGCGGSIDVIGGYKKRAPKIFTSTNTEWAYRIANEPKRFARFVKTNLQFFSLVRKGKK